MAWNEPGKDDQKDQDPWNKNNKKNEQGPPDLDVIFQKLSGILGGLFGQKTTQGPTGNNNNSGKIVAAVVVILAVIWFASGWYTVKESERGVVLRFGSVQPQVQPGLHWNPKFIDKIIFVDVERTRRISTAGFMLTKDQNILQVAMEVQYRIRTPSKYLFSVTNADNSLLQALDSSLRSAIGNSKMDDALTNNRTGVRQETWKMLDGIIKAYDLGIQIVDVNLQKTSPPEQVQAAFDDASAAQEDQARFIEEANAYKVQQEPLAKGQVSRIEEDAKAYSKSVILKAQGAVAKFNKLLPEYKAYPEITRQRLYIESMEKVLSNSSKVLIENKSGGNLTFLPLDKLMNRSIQDSTVPTVETEIQTRSRADEEAGNNERSTTINNERATFSSRSAGRG